jgi:hypothetical protein
VWKCCEKSAGSKQSDRKVFAIRKLRMARMREKQRLPCHPLMRGTYSGIEVLLLAKSEWSKRREMAM